MSARKERLLVIERILKERKIESQEQLLATLDKEGYTTTQATLSRDLKAMRVIKVSEGKAYRYKMQAKNKLTEKKAEKRLQDLIADGIISIEYSLNIAVLKTLPGYASSIAAILDEAQPKEVIGSIAGDDTIMLVMREGVTSLGLEKSLLGVLSKLAKE